MFLLACRVTASHLCVVSFGHITVGILYPCLVRCRSKSQISSTGRLLGVNQRKYVTGSEVTFHV